jgi:hypothetical protein
MCVDWIDDVMRNKMMLWMFGLEENGVKKTATTTHRNQMKVSSFFWSFLLQKKKCEFLRYNWIIILFCFLFFSFLLNHNKV